MTDQTIPRIEAILFTYLGDHPDLSGVRVAGSLPSKQSQQAAPWVKVVQLDATDRSSGLEHLIEYLVQFDCYAGATAQREHDGQSEAADVALTVRALLKAAQGTVLDTGLSRDLAVSQVSFAGMPRLPDTDYEKPRERYVLTAEITGHWA